MAERPRLWGIDVVAAVYALASLLMVWLIGIGSDVGRIFGMVLAPICAFLAAGIFFRFNPVRILLLILLGIAVVGDGLLVFYYLGGLFDLVSVPSNKDPMEELLKMPFRFGLTIWMFLYLWRSDVRDAFRRHKKAVPDTEVEL